MRLPPYGKQFVPVPTSGVRVAVGPGAWEMTNGNRFPVMVLPQGEDASSFTWPCDNRPALVFETGQPDDRTLEGLARELLIAGASSVVAIREALLSSDPRVFFDRGTNNVVT